MSAPVCITGPFSLLMRLFLVFLLPLLLVEGDGAKILFISPNLANSMVLFTGRLADVLVRAGHNVVSSRPSSSSRLLADGVHSGDADGRRAERHATGDGRADARPGRLLRPRDGGLRGHVRALPPVRVAAARRVGGDGGRVRR